MGRPHSSNRHVLKFLQEFKPKLITNKDIKKLNLLHKVANGGRHVIANSLLKCIPEAISTQDDKGNLPLHIACQCQSTSPNRKLMRTLLRSGIKKEIGGSAGFGGLYVKNNEDLTPMDYALTNADEVVLGHSDRKNKKRWLAVNELMYTAHDAPILQSAMNVGVKGVNLKSLVEQYPNCARVVDSNGQLPLHLALTKGIKADDGLKEIIDTYPAGLDDFDPVTGLPPFALAASNSRYDTDYYCKLLCRSPTFFSSKKW
eukprot:845156_1